VNTLYYGDNLDILREYIPSDSVDLCYLDPPFNAARTFNILFSDKEGHPSEAQIKAFDDTWTWNQAAAETYDHLLTEESDNISQMISSMRQIIKEGPLLAYLVMMTVRLIELHRVLKQTGTLYLHCDPTASHYLKMVLDCIFGLQNFGNEIIWQRTNAKGLAFTRFARNHDVILRYSKSDKATWNPQYTEHDQNYVNTFYRYIETETGRRYRLADLTNPNKDRPNLTYEFLGVTRVWGWTKDRMQKAYEEGLIVQNKPGGVPALKRYLDEQEGNAVGDVWMDILPVQSQAKEKLGYPTQKPLALLERIIEASSNPGDVVLDPFCGCGTAVAAAQKLDRQWIGIDITSLAIALIKNRMEAMFPGLKVKTIGDPKDLASAQHLASEDRYQFQWWALSLIPARPLGGSDGGKTGKKGSDKGIDGVVNFIDDASGNAKRVLVQVKSGHVKSGDVRDLRGTVEREKAAIGVFVTLEPPTKDMTQEAISAGFYKSAGWGKSYPTIQILTVDELLHGAKVQMPPAHGTFKQAAVVKVMKKNEALDFEGPGNEDTG